MPGYRPPIGYGYSNFSAGAPPGHRSPAMQPQYPGISSRLGADKVPSEEPSPWRRAGGWIKDNADIVLPLVGAGLGYIADRSAGRSRSREASAQNDYNNRSLEVDTKLGLSRIGLDKERLALEREMFAADEEQLALENARRKANYGSILERRKATGRL